MFPELPFDFRCHHFMDLSVQLQMHVYRRSEAEFVRWEKRKDGLRTVEEARAWQEHIRKTALDAIGGLPSSDSPLAPRVTGELKGEGFRVEKVIYESSPGVEVTSALYVPDGLKGRTAAVLFVCGHSLEAKGYPVYQAVCHRLVRNGLVVLAVDPPGQGERKSYLDGDGREIVRWGTSEHDYVGLQCWWLGQSSARYFIHDAVRGIDYLQSRPEVDASRIGVTGNSGGGTQSSWLMMIEPRLAAAAPGTYVMRRLEYMWTGQAQDSEQVIPGGTLNGLDHEDFLIAMAPRPVLVLAADYDYFCGEGTVRSVERAGRIYRLFDREENLGLARARTTHSYSPGLAKASTEFFCKHLLQKPASELDHTDPEPFAPEDLWCTKKGQVLLDDPSTRRIFDRNLAEYESRDGKTGTEGAAAWLKEKVTEGRDACELNPRWPWDAVVEGVRVSQGFWFTEARVCNAGFLIRPAEGGHDDLTIVLLDRGTLDMHTRRQWLIDEVRGGHALLVMDVRGFGNLLPRPVNPIKLEERYGTVFKLTSDLVCLGDDLASMRVYDVLRAVDLARTDPMIDLGGKPVRIFGSGTGGFYAYISAAIDGRVASCEIEDAFFSLDSLMRTRYYHDDRLNQLLVFGMAARFDLPDLEPLFAGRKLSVLRPRDARGRIMESSRARP